MRADDLPRLGVIANPMDANIFGQWIDLSGKKLLVLGMSEDQVDSFIAPHGPESVTMFTYWAEHVDAHSTKYPLVMGDITQPTQFDGDSFDAVLTLSLLEHVSDVAAALREMARVARTEMVHFFGPAWSCAYGHHLYVDEGDPNLNFAKWQMPAHMHMLCDEEEICDYYEGLGYGRDVGRMVFNQFHRNDFINRLFYDDYVAIMHRYQVVRWETMFNRLPTDHLSALQNLFSDCRDFSTYGGCYHLLT